MLRVNKGQNTNGEVEGGGSEQSEANKSQQPKPNKTILLFQSHQSQVFAQSRSFGHYT